MLGIFPNHVWVVSTFSFLAGSPPTAIYVIQTCRLSKRTLAKDIHMFFLFLGSRSVASKLIVSCTNTVEPCLIIQDHTGMILRIFFTDLFIYTDFES